MHEIGEKTRHQKQPELSAVNNSETDVSECIPWADVVCAMLGVWVRPFRRGAFCDINTLF